MFSFAFVAGLLTHVVYFHRGEHHLYPVRYIRSAIVVMAVAAIVLSRSNQSGGAMKSVLSAALYFFVGLYSSLLMYRILFNPLNRFPGPFGAKVSDLWFSARLGKGDAYRKIQALHHKYGDFVHIGPSDLSTIHPKAVEAIYGGKSRCTKSQSYDTNMPFVSLHATRDRAFHDQRRRLWSTAFSDRALRGYEQRVTEYQNKLLERIDDNYGQSVNISRLFNFYSFDVMGELTFGNSFNMLDTNESHWMVDMLHAGLRPFQFMFPVWFIRLVVQLFPFVMKNFYKLVHFCEQQLETRRKVIPRPCRLCMCG